MRVSRRSRSCGGIVAMVGCAVVLAMMGMAVARAGAPDALPEPIWTEQQRNHWSFLPPQRPEVPTVQQSGWVRNPIDAFILSELEEFGLEPARAADRVTLIRRLSFDLTGLPPSPEEVDAFVADTRPDAYERLVDHMLLSPAYGERWARFWLDLARYAESDGFKSDKTRPDAWRFRDWVIRALNDDMPYDEFVRLQLAGDEIVPGDPDAFLATAFNRHWPFEDNNKVPGLNRQLMLEDMTDTTSSVFLGLTLGCARCHDHKYDPISQKDYYRFQAIFSASTPKDDFPLVSAAEEALQASVQAEHKARVDRVRRDIETVEQPYLATLLKDRLSKLPADVRKAFETEPEKRSAFQEDLLQKNAAALAVAPQKMQSAMSPEDRGLWESREQTMKAILKQAPRPMPVATGMTDTSPQAPPVFLLRKGNYTNPGEEVPPGFLSVLTGTKEPISAPKPEGTPTSGRRRALAEWL